MDGYQPPQVQDAERRNLITPQPLWFGDFNVPNLFTGFLDKYAAIKVRCEYDVVSSSVKGFE